MNIKTLISGENSQELKILLAHCLNKSASFFYAYPDYQLNAQEQQRWSSLQQRYDQGEPLAYILGKQAFFSLDFSVTPDVLIPRSDTECLVQWLLDHYDYSCRRIVDLGTGSGAIACTLAYHRPQWQVMASDRSQAALAVAKKNAAALDVDVAFLLGEWCQPLQGRFDIIVSNPPYIARDDVHIANNVERYEPQQALFADEAGFADLLLIAQQARDYLQPGGQLVLEHGFMQQQYLIEQLQCLGYQSAQGYKDLSGHDRFVVATFSDTG